MHTSQRNKGAKRRSVMPMCPDTQHQEKSWSIFVRRCKEIEMSSKKGGDVFAPKNSAQADGDNAGLGKIPEILYVFYKTLIDEAGF